MANDFLGAEISSATVRAGDLRDGRTLSLDLLRNAQFSRVTTFRQVSSELARQFYIYDRLLPRFLPELHRLFEEATDGISLESYFQAMLLMLAHFRFSLQPNEPLLDRQSLYANLGDGRRILESVVNKWTRTPGQYREAYAGWARERPAAASSYDLVLLRETPIIELEPGKMLCPHIPFLIAKIVDEPYFILDDFLTGKQQSKFHQAVGMGYEEYAHEQLERIARHDKAGAWEIHKGWTGKTSDSRTWEVDTYLQRGTTAIVFEHKGIRPSTKFLRGGDGDNVLGPPQPLLERIVTGEAVDVSDGIARKTGDEGLLTRGLWQLSSADGSLLDKAAREVGTRPVRAFPVLTHMASLPLPEEIHRGYLTPLVIEAGLLSEDYWEVPQWLDIRQLEILAALAVAGDLDLEALVSDKATRQPHRRFDAYIYDVLLALGGEPINPGLEQVWKSLLRGAEEAFFPGQRP